MSDVRRRTQRSCKRCGKIYFGGAGSARVNHAENVVLKRTCTDCGRTFPPFLHTFKSSNWYT